jgi:hypothetical protein
VPIYVADKSICPICGEVIKETDKRVGFPPFIGNTNDPLYLFDDRMFHSDCITAHPLFSELMKRYSDYQNKFSIPQKEKPCDHCHKPLTVDEYVKDDIFIMPYISYGNSEFKKFDYLYLHAHCIPNYKYIHELQEALNRIKNEGWWGGNAIAFKLSYIEIILKNPNNIPNLNFLYTGKGQSIEEIATQERK